MPIDPYSSIEQLGTLLRDKQISSVELTKFYLDRLERFGSRLGDDRDSIHGLDRLRLPA